MLKYRLKCCLLGQYFLITVYQVSLEIRSKIVLSFFAQIKFFTVLHHLTIVPSVMVGDNEGMLIWVPGVEPPVGWDASAGESAAAGASVTLAESETVTDFQSSPSSANKAIRVPT